MPIPCSNHQSSLTNSTQPSSSTLTRPERSPKLAVPSRQTPASPRRHASPQVIVSHPTQDVDHEDFSRRLKISSSPSPRPAQPSHKQTASSKLFNPDPDPIPMRRVADPEVLSDGTGSSYVHVPRAAASATANHRDERGNTARQLFDHRKDDPVRFSVLGCPPHGRPTPTSKSSGDYISASSTSSCAASISTLSSTTDGSSASSALFDGRPSQGPGTEDSGNSVFSVQLKKLCRNITNLEIKIKQEDSMNDVDDGMNTRVMLKGKEVENEGLEKEKWKKQIFDHTESVFFCYLIYFANVLNIHSDSRTPFTISSRFPERPPCLHLSATSRQSTISSSDYGHSLFINYSNPSTALPSPPL